MGKVTWLQVHTCNASPPEAEAEGSSQAECPMCTNNFWVCHWRRHLTSLGLTSLLRMTGMIRLTLGYWEAKMIVSKAVRYSGVCLSITSPSRWVCSTLIWCSQTAVTPDCVSVTVLCCSDNLRCRCVVWSLHACLSALCSHLTSTERADAVPLL